MLSLTDLYYSTHNLQVTCEGEAAQMLKMAFEYKDFSLFNSVLGFLCFFNLITNVFLRPSVSAFCPLHPLC